MKVFAIVVTFNGMKWISKCLNSLINSSIPLKIVVVDNYSTDGTIEYITEKYSQIILLKSVTNLGFGKANNIGIKYALEYGCNYVYLLNQDAWVDSNTIEQLIKIQKKNPLFGIISPMQMNSQKEKIDNNLCSLMTNSFCPGIIDDLLRNRLKDLYEIKFVMAAHWLISADCLRKTGGFSPVFYHYGEDENYINRVHFHGFKVGLCPKLQVVHDREFRKDAVGKKAYLTYTSRYLVPLCDIRYPLISILIRSYLKLILFELKFSLKERTFLPLQYLLKSIVSIPKGIYYRRKTKYETTPFL